MSSSLFVIASAIAEHSESGGSIARIANDLGINVPAVLAQMVNFAVVAFLLYRFAVKPVLATVELRQKTIADGLRYTDEMKARLADAEKQHAETLKKGALEAQKIVEEARLSAKELLDRETKQATERTQQIMAKAEQAIELDRRKMLADARQEISRLVALTAQRVLNRELSADERTRYSESAARELTNV